MKLIVNTNQNLFFTSDTHYNHSNICRGTSKWLNSDNLTRDFSTLEEMNDQLVDRINEVVKEDDILIHHGDWSFGGFDSIEEFRNRINCRNIHLILGNHDHHIRKNRNNIQSIFSSVHTYLDLDLRIYSKTEKGVVYRHSLVCMHYPIASWDSMNRGVIHTHGHVHLPSNLRIHEGRSMDVGVDGNNLYPIPFSEIRDLLKFNPIKSTVLPKDHHVE